jgi:DNA-binding response OmpR family regulator
MQSLLIKVGTVTFDTVTREVTVGVTHPRLTAIELGILEILMQRSPAVVSRRTIALAVWEDEANALGSNTLDVHMARLRSKISNGGVKIEAARAVGYRIVIR